VPDTAVRTEVQIDLRGFITNSLVEWEGRVAAVVFTAHCNWRCAYCHGWRFVQEPEALKPVGPEEVFALLERQRGWIDGVAVTGGEPTLQPGLAAFLQEIKAFGVEVKLETNGTRPEVIARLLEADLVDCLALDYKAPLDARLVEVSAVGPAVADVEAVRRSFALAAGSGIEREYHTTLCPRFIDLPTLEAMGQALEPGGLWVLQQYEPGDCLDGARAGSLRYDVEELERLEQAARQRHERVLLRRGRGA